MELVLPQLAQVVTLYELLLVKVSLHGVSGERVSLSVLQAGLPNSYRMCQAIQNHFFFFTRSELKGAVAPRNSLCGCKPLSLLRLL